MNSTDIVNSHLVNSKYKQFIIVLVIYNVITQHYLMHIYIYITGVACIVILTHVYLYLKDMYQKYSSDYLW